MASTTVQVPLARERHDKFTPLIPGTPTTTAARCTCGATWSDHPADPRHPTFSEWAMNHLGPRCHGSGELIHEGSTTHGKGRCPNCGLIYGTSPAAGYEGWRYLDTHVVTV